MRLPRALTVLILFGCALVVFFIFGCQGVGEATLVEFHRFQGYDAGLDVYDPPPLAPLLNGGPVWPQAGQFSPDGKWLYIVFASGGSDTLASRGLTEQSSVLRATVEVQSHCFFTCAGDARVQATRYSLDRAVDPANPPKVLVNDSTLRIEPWLP
jgi:hypothetical protein